MATKSQRKKDFLTKHPICCFCGGDTPATEPDHIPSRVLFDNRQWPEGYVFPACVACNRETRHDEQVVAMLSRAYPNPETPEAKNEMQERIRAVQHNYPQILIEMEPSIREKRNAAKTYGIPIPEGMTSADLPILNASGPLVNKAVTNFGRKLFLALFYKHSNDILSKRAGISLLWFPNLKIENGELPRELANLVSNFPTLERSTTNLSDQFFYRYIFSDDSNLAVFIAFFRQSFAILGYVNKNSDDFQLPEDATILAPFECNGQVMLK